MIGGIHGVRLLAAAYADVMLRQKGVLPPLKAKGWGRRRGKPWTDDEFDRALAMRSAGLTNAEIAGVLKRSVWSVHGKIGYQKVAA